ncbi:MAG: PAS domain S-box protein [candidate division Zixibacteria bacterium]|nr:PAS domain S-box protein [candidate division Zixibacteria bacterium]
MQQSGGSWPGRVIRAISQPGMKYETELYSVLLLIVLFLVLVNFGSIRIVTQLRGVFENQIYADLAETANHASQYLGDQPQLLSSTADWSRFVLNTYADSIELLETSGIGITAIPRSAGRLSESDMQSLADGDPLSVAPDSKSLAPGYVVLFPFETTDRRTFILRVYKRADRFGVIANVVQFNMIFQIAGILAVVILGYLYLRVTLRPYLKMKKAAESAAAEKTKDEVSVEQIVASFQSMIDELKEKEKILQDLYQKTQKRAARLEQFNEYILAGMASGLINCDRDGMVTHFNRSAQRLLGIGERQALGHPISDVLSSKPELSKLITDTLAAEGNASRCEMQIEGIEGGMISLGVSTTLITDELNRKIGVTAIMTDLTEIKRLQKDIAYKEKMAALGETAAGLAHELRNSMTAVVGFGKLMTRLAGDNPQISDAAEAIARESSASEEMLTRFLEFAQPTNLNLDSVDVRAIIDDLMAGMTGHASRKNLTLRCDNDQNTVSVWGDKLAIRQALSNLLVNAIDAAQPEGEVVVSISDQIDSSHVGISISDDGPGIPFSIRERIFTPFFTTKEDGTGLGLCMVRKLINGMNGRINLSPPSDDGLTVTIILPRTDSTIAAIDRPHRLEVELPHSFTS